MTRTDWPGIIGRVKLVGALSLANLCARPAPRLAHDDDAFVVSVSWMVPDRDTGELKCVAFHQHAPRSIDDSQAVAWLHHFLGSFMLHEASEALIFDGGRPFDPHRNETP